MTEDEYDALMKKALTNDLHWHGLTATPIEAREARDWLEETLLRVKRNFEIRKAEMNLLTARHPRRTPAYYREVERYEDWKIRAMHFRNLCEDRLRELKKSHLLRHPGAAKPSALQKAQAHSEYMNRQMQQISTSLIKLAEAVATFEAGEISTKDLAANLDTLTIPHNNDSTITLRELLANSRKKRLEVVS